MSGTDSARCLVLTQPMSGTGVAPSGETVKHRPYRKRTHVVDPLLYCFALSGTDGAHATTRLLCPVEYQPYRPMRAPASPPQPYIAPLGSVQPRRFGWLDWEHEQAMCCAGLHCCGAASTCNARPCTDTADGNNCTTVMFRNKPPTRV
eukprot:1416640-Rhodomonas_salina.2